MKRKIVLIVALVLAIVLVGIAYGAVLYQITLSNKAGVAVVGSIHAYWDAGCTQSAVSWDWGQDLVAKQSKTKGVFIRNEGNTKLWIGWDSPNFQSYDASFYYSAVGASFDTSSYVFQMLDDNVFYGGHSTSGAELKELAKGAVLALSMNLIIGNNPVPGSFSFDVVFTSYDSATG